MKTILSILIYLSFQTCFAQANFMEPLKSIEQNTHMMNQNLTKWHLTNSGLIIVHPFLPQLFKYLNYRNNSNYNFPGLKAHRSI